MVPEMEIASVIPLCAPDATAAPRAAPLPVISAPVREMHNNPIHIQFITIFKPPLVYNMHENNDIAYMNSTN